MKRYKRIYILLGVLAAACVVTFGVSQYQERQELIRNSGEVFLEIPSDTVQALSWEYGETSLAFHRDEVWLYDEDEAFPVDEETIEALLSPFASFAAAFVIEEVEDFGQYGLDDPVCSIHLTTEEETYDILLGDYSTMDSQRYLSIGDGNVYLVENDPMDDFSLVLSDMIDNDDIPVFDTVERIAFSGPDTYEVSYEEEGGESYREEDVYFTELDGEVLPLDTDKVDGYLQDIRLMDLGTYVTYNATEEEIAACGLDDPELTVTVDYADEDEEGNAVSGTFVLHISRDPEELAAAEESETAEDSEDTAGEDAAAEEEEEITAYARIGDSPILYQLAGADYEALMAASRDDLRHSEVLPADAADITQLAIGLDGETYTITSLTDGEERSYYYQEELTDLTDIQSALDALTADRFTRESPSGPEEIALTLTLDREGDPTVDIVLYRYDGACCLAEVDGKPVSLVERNLVVDLVEAVNAIVLG